VTSPRPVASLPAAAPAAAPSAGSAWNAAGTWEERDISSKAREALRGALVSAEPLAAGAGRGLKVTKVTKCDGSVTKIASRGKIKVGFELALAFEWELLVAGAPVATGSASIEELVDHDADLFDCFNSVSVISTPGQVMDKSGATAGVKASADAFRRAVRAWIETVRAM
jgi:hypothetical protein